MIPLNVESKLGKAGSEDEVELWMLRKVGQQLEVKVYLENCCKSQSAGRTGGGNQGGAYMKSHFRNGENRVWSKTQITMC